MVYALPMHEGVPDAKHHDGHNSIWHDRRLRREVLCLHSRIVNCQLSVVSLVGGSVDDLDLARI
jgi:hypothetical protein